MLSARDLPPCDLSDHLEKRLARALQMERQQVSLDGLQFILHFFAIYHVA